jgi:hypothetical protein
VLPNPNDSQEQVVMSSFEQFNKESVGGMRLSVNDDELDAKAYARKSSKKTRTVPPDHQRSPEYKQSQEGLSIPLVQKSTPNSLDQGKNKMLRKRYTPPDTRQPTK